MADILISVVAKVAEYTVAPIGRQAGYFLFYNGNLKELADHVKELEGVRERMEHRVEDERRNGKEIETDVTNWLDEVNKIIETANQFQDDPRHAKVGCSGWLFPNCISRHQLSRKATKIIEDIVVQLQRYEKFGERVGYHRPLDEVAFSSTTGGKKLVTREAFKEGIVKALKDSPARIVGVYGLGGVGKTTLVKEVAEIAKQKKLFDAVVIAKVSANPDIKNIQGEIADMLSSRLEEESIAGRARRLKSIIKSKKSILVILDDIWTRIDLEEIGIPSRDESNAGCKLLMTSRNEHVLLEMNAQKDFTFRLDILNETEAWNLFQFTVGDNVVNDINLRDVATKVAKKCGGLPLSIVTMAGKLREKDIYYWEDALREFESVGDAEFDSVLKFSYNSLDNEEMKELFLLLAVGEDSTEYYLKLAIGLKIFKGINTVRDARNRLLKIIGSLKSYCLLLESSPTGLIKMHDNVRKGANFIAYRDKHVFVVKEWPINQSMTNCTQIILDRCHIHELPQRLDCLNIELFFLCSADRSLEIPNSFFEGMGSLKVLDLTNLNLSLPTSFQSVTSLQTLCLEYCVLENMEVIGALKNLEILSLRKSSLNKFPSEIGKLGQLRMLDLSHSGIEIIPPNIISCLTKLEELEMGNTSIKWEDGNSLEQNVNASLAELRKLSNLTSLELQVREARVLPRDLQLVFEKLKRYKIAIGDVWEWSQIKNETLNTLMLKIPSFIHLGPGIKALIKGVEYLCLDEIDGIQNVLYQLNAEGFPLLKRLHIQHNTNMKHIVDTMNRDRAPASFINLERLVLKNLRNLEQICHGPLATNSFCKLGVIQVKDCVQLKYLLSFSMLKELSHLSEIEVSQCHSMKGIMLRDNNSSAVEEITDELDEFLSLRSLTLDHLPTLDNFITHELMSSVTEQKNQGPKSCVSTPFFNALVVFPKLDALKLSSLNMNKIWDENQHSMCNLTSLIVENCGGLKYLLLPTMVESFKSLKRLEISKCHLMDEIIATENRNNGTIALKGVHFAKLETIILKDMKNLKTTWHCYFDTVKTLQVANCEKIVVIFPTSGQKTYHNLETLEVKDCALVEEIFELTSGENSSVEDTMHLKEITLERLPKLKKIWSMDPQGIMTFHNLENVHLDNCGSLEYLFPLSIASCCSLLKELCIKECVNLKEIIAKKKEFDCIAPIILEFNQLNTLTLCNLYKLEGFYAGSHTLTFPSLRTIDVGGCTKLNLYKTVSTSKPETSGDGILPILMQQVFIVEEVIPNLEKLGINSRDAEMILQAQNVDTLFTKLTFLRLSDFMNEDATLFPYWFLQNVRTLERLVVEESSFEEIFQVERVVREKIHTRLKKLTLSGLPNLKHICHEGYQIDPSLELLEVLWVQHCPSLINLLPSSVIFNHLTYLKIVQCHGLIHLISSSTAQILVNLTTMIVEDCNSLEEIITGEENVGDIAFTSLQILMLECLPRLRKFCSNNYLKFPLLDEVVVRECPRMEIFSNGNTSTPNLRKVKTAEDCEESHWNWNLNDTIKNMFEDKVAFCKFKSLTLSEYPELKDLWYGCQLQDKVFCNLKSLVVQRCDFLSDVLFPSNLLQVLHGLEEVEVRDCDSLEALFDVKGMKKKSKEIQVKQSSRLKRLTLSNLPKLKDIWNDDPSYDIISFRNLCTVYVYKCQSLLHIFPLSICQDLGQLEKLHIESCDGVEKIVAAAMEEEEEEGDLNTTIQHLFIEKVQFSKLETIILKDMKNLKTIWHSQFDTVKTLQVVTCEKIVVVFPTSWQKTYCNLEKLEVKDCALVEEIFELTSSENSSIEDTTHLKEITLEGLPKLKKIWSMDPQGIMTFHNLQNVHLYKCGSLEYLFPLSTIASCCSLLKELCIKECVNLKEIIAKKREFDCIAPIILEFNRLNSLTLWHLYKLEGFYAGSHTLTFPSLRTIDVAFCTKLNLYKTVSTSKPETSRDGKLPILMQQVFIVEEVIPNLECLRINNRDGDVILQAQNVDTLFTKLTFFGLSSYESEGATLPYWFLQNMPTLEQMNVEWSSFEKIFQDERVVVSEKIIHTRLKKLALHQLPKLQHICEEGYRIDPVLELLEVLWVEHCPSLKNLLLPSSATFNHLIYLRITNCNGLIHLITSSTARSLVKLTTLMVEDCNSLEEVIKGEENVDDIAFTSLEVLKLESLPKLNNFCSNNCCFKFPLLEEVVVRECPRMKIFSKGNTSAPILRKVQIGKNYKKGHWNGNLNDAVRNMFEDKEVSHPDDK